MGVDYQNGHEVVAIEPEAHQVHAKDGDILNYDRLVIASGSRLFAPLKGSELSGVYNFKSLSAAKDLVNRIKQGEAHSAVIVGAGFIGMEIALLLRELDIEVIQVEMLDQVMSTMLDKDSADVALDLMLERGVDVRLNCRAKAFVGTEKASAVQLDSGEVLEADILIAATGVKPNIEFIDGSGISHYWGITVDDHLRTNAPNVYAAGDVVEAADRLTGEPYVHAIFPNAVEQGHVVGLNLAGFDTTYQGAERMNSLKHLGLPIMAVGLKEGDEILQTKRNGELRTLYVNENRLVGFQLVGDIRAAGILRTLINQKRDIRPIKDQLLEPLFRQGIMVWKALNPSIPSY
jgi:NAD(P)H-nitrite reductase large subunit